MASPRLVLSLSLLFALDPSPTPAEIDAAPVEQAERPRRDFRVNETWHLRLGPVGDLYPRYIADPRRPGFGIGSAWFSDSDIPAAGDSRFLLRLGGRYGFLRFHPEGEPERGFQIDAEGSFVGQFDQDNSTDNIGWDGLYGLQLAWAPGQRLALRASLFHDSSHVGDEYAESTGRRRIEYTREELRGGVSFKLAPRWRVYGEAGYGWGLRDEMLMEPWRLQSGLEYESPYSLWRGRAGWYVATDVSHFEEDDGGLNVTAQGGLMYRIDEVGRVYRIGLEFHGGRSQIGEFFQARETYVALGVWFDL